MKEQSRLSSKISLSIGRKKNVVDDGLPPKYVLRSIYVTKIMYLIQKEIKGDILFRQWLTLVVINLRREEFEYRYGK